MTMVKVKYFVAILLASFSLIACTPEQDDLFDKTATERSASEINRVKTLLTNAANGWHLEYYGDLTYGGYNVLMKFEGDSVTVASEKAGDSHKAGIGTDGKCITARSHFKLEQSMGVVLSVDEYNEVFHYFSMPNNPDYGYKDVGFEGDFEFRVVKADADSIILRGKKHNDRIVMTPVPADVTWENVIQEADNTLAFIDSRNYTLSGENYNEQVVAVKIYHTLRFQWRDSIGQLQTVYTPFISKKDGYKFYTAYNIRGINIDGIVKGDSRDRFFLSNNDKMWLYPYLPTLMEHLSGSQWFVTYSNLGVYGQQNWDSFRQTFKKRDEKLDVAYAYLGTDGTRFALHMNMDNNAIYEGLSFVSNEDQTEVTLTWDAGNQHNVARKNYTKWGLAHALEPFCGTRGRTFVISTDNQRDPSYLILTDKDEPSNIIKLMANTIYYPFNN